MSLLTQADLADLNHNMESRTPLELMRWAKSTFGERTAILSSMQRAGCMICHMAYANKIDLPVLFVDTGVNFQETLDTRDRVAREYSLKIVNLEPKLSMSEQIAEFGILYLSHEGQEQCCDMRKTVPLLSIAGQYDALVASLRRGDGEKRKKVPILAVDPKMNCLRVNILAAVADQEFADYLRDNNVITNPLHAQGYTTIGCNRCTTPTLPDEPKRAGRWRHLGPWAMYCGINPTDLNQSGTESIDLPDDLIDRILGRKVDYAI